MYIMGGLYLFTLPMRGWLSVSPSQRLWCVTVTAFLCAMGDMAIRARLGSESNTFSRSIPFIGYYLAGFLLRDIILSARQCWGAVAIFVVSWLLTAVGTAILCARLGPTSLGLMLYDFLSPTVILMSVSLFLLVRTVVRREAQVSTKDKFVATLSSATLGVYLVHPAILDLIREHGITPVTPSVWIGLPVSLETIS